MDDAEDLFAMVFQQFSKRNSSSSTLSGCYQLLLDPAFGFTPDAKFDMEGFRNMMALRAEVEGKTTNAPERYLDFSYYDAAMKLVGR